MSLVHKIPPLVSALAFGYGVGMAAPESTLQPVKHAAVIVQPSFRDGPPLPSVSVSTRPLQLPSTLGRSGNTISGLESGELSKLRAAPETRSPHERGETCDLDRPTYSRPPRNESLRDRLPDEVDDLDAAGSEALSRLQLPDLRLSITRRTLKYVKFFTRNERGRQMFETWLRRSGRYQDVIQSELREKRLPDDLIWVAMIESGFDPRAKSPAGAVGLWQFMPATGSVYGLVQNRTLDQRKNPKLATQAAAHHLHDLYLRFGSWDLALAAYNMGYEQLLDAIDKYGTADFNELARQEAIPQETAMYVPKIAAAAIVANNLEHFGFDRVEVMRPVEGGEIAVPSGTPIRTLAKACGVSTSQIRAMNPDILGDRVPSGRGDYVLEVPADTVSRARASLPALLENEPVVTDEAAALEPVDLLSSREIARRTARSEDESLLSLLPPARHRHTLRAPVLDDEPDARADDDAGNDDEPLFAPRRSHKKRETMLYKAGAGDSLPSIARQFGIDVEDVARENHLDVGDKLREGQMLKLKVRRDMVDEVTATVEGDKEEKAAPKRRAHESDAPRHHHRGKGTPVER